MLSTFWEERNVHIFRVRWSNESILLLLLLLTICARLYVRSNADRLQQPAWSHILLAADFLPSDLLPCCLPSFVLLRGFLTVCFFEHFLYLIMFVLSAILISSLVFLFLLLFLFLCFVFVLCAVCWLCVPSPCCCWACDWAFVCPFVTYCLLFYLLVNIYFVFIVNF